MSIQNKKVVLIQNEKDIHVHVLLALQVKLFGNSATLEYSHLQSLAMFFLLRNESSHPLDALKVSLFITLANFKACCWINGPLTGIHVRRLVAS